jgi:hypothetical protein
VGKESADLGGDRFTGKAAQGIAKKLFYNNINFALESKHSVV